MKTVIALFFFICSFSLEAAEWPVGLVQSTFDRCITVGGTGQCQCLVVNLQQKFTFEDIQLTNSSRIAKESLRQMTRAFNVKCLGKAFKEKTLKLTTHYFPRKIDKSRFR